MVLSEALLKVFVLLLLLLLLLCCCLRHSRVAGLRIAPLLALTAIVFMLLPHCSSPCCCCCCSPLVC
jgi:hypothetical protein